jgi:ribulose-5-phosphate 4-epimerase/fuculose-1-phosphate aldolase
MLKASDMVHVDAEGKVIGGSGKAVNSAGFLIHGAIHEARPDVMAAAHAHSNYAVAWSTFGRPLDNLNQDTCMFYDHQAVYKNFGGIVLEKEEGARIAAVLGPKGKVAHLQNHGLLTCGSTVDEAAHLFNVVERQCKTQFLVESAGIPKTYVSDEEQAYTGGILSDPVSIDSLGTLGSDVC